MNDEKYVCKNIKGLWTITEVLSGNVMGYFTMESDALNTMFNLMDGGPFDGFTPSFILSDPKNALANTAKTLHEE